MHHSSRMLYEIMRFSSTTRQPPGWLQSTASRRTGRPWRWFYLSAAEDPSAPPERRRTAAPATLLPARPRLASPAVVAPFPSNDEGGEGFAVASMGGDEASEEAGGTATWLGLMLSVGSHGGFGERWPPPR
ncbi:hypothetical protein QYE76_062600 [Lolium multiflorum]|uniref:Uncharacterized protein n=1 Tax=Lolium multiflorum TaxID=4521 RepID=A0AAD8W7E5_LOLMU|nr:hypothetical protein QYE76_062600 [Lolium multiflorum]